MRPPRRFSLLLVLASVAFAGDPIPDVDVILEQIPPGVVIEVPNGAPFDRLTLGGPRDFIAGLQPDRLPSGWAMSREGKRVVLSGPAVSVPTRMRLRAGRTLDKSVDWDVSIAGRALASRSHIVPRAVARQAVRNSLQGVVVMPGKVSPGEAVALRPLPGANLPPGRFVLSGVVMGPLSDEDFSAGTATANTTSGKLEKSMVTAPRAGFVLESPEGTSCREVLPLAAVLVGAGSTGECAGCKSFFESRSNTAKRTPGESAPIGGAPPPEATYKSFYESRSNTAKRAPKTRVTEPWSLEAGPLGGSSSWDAAEVSPRMTAPAGGPPAQLRSGHDSAKNPIRNLKALYAVGPSAGAAEGSASFTIDQKGGKRWELSPPGGSTVRMQVQERPPSRPTAWVVFELTETAAGCLVTARDPDLFDLALAMQAQKPRDERPQGKPNRDAASPFAPEPPGAVLEVGRVPDDLLPGTALSLQYVDIFGDVVVDVPAVDGTEVVPPSPEPEPPCVTAATAFAQAEDTVCVCGSFPSAAAQAAVRVDERAAGLPLSLSARALQFQLPRHALTPGRHVWSGDPEFGFLPTCRAWTEVIQIGGEIDSQRLLSGQSTPMRLTVNGTADRVPIQIRNLTPSIVRVDGGEAQTVESTGGAPNTVTRSVQGLVRGDFQLEWSLATVRCPCP